MRYIKINVRTALVMHGYDADNQEIVEHLREEQFVEKVLLLDRLQSLTEKYLLVTSSHGRVMYWEYSDGFEAVKGKLRQAGLLIE